MKKVLSIILSLTMLLSAASVLAVPASAASKTGKKYVTYKTISKKVTKKGTAILKGKAKYPQLKSKSKAAKKINAYFKKTVKKIIKNINKTAKEDYARDGLKNFKQFNSCYDFDVNIKFTYNAKGKYSFRMSDYEYWMGAHGYTAVTGHTFSKTTGKRISNAKATKYSGAQLKEKIVAAAEKTINKEPSKYYSNALESIKDMKVNKFNTWLQGEYLHVYFNAYDIASYAAGPTDLKIKL